ncbi:MAG TPA: hypothetical protein PKK00_05095 [Bacteroidales bacterium]|nr:hypothetical protein [Bacteroidales bacterium]HPS16735.1 hypothetical protein [Bacteroidales bacterium]
MTVTDNKKSKKIFITIGITFLICGIALLITKLLSGNSEVYASVMGAKLTFTGEIAIFVGVFFILLKSIKFIHAIISSIIVIVSVGLLMNYYDTSFKVTSYPIKMDKENYNSEEQTDNEYLSPKEMVKKDSINKQDSASQKY